MCSQIWQSYEKNYTYWLSTLLTFSSAILLLKATLKFTNEITCCMNIRSVFLNPNFLIVYWRERCVNIKWSIYMMRFIINSLLNSNYSEQFAISGKKQVYRWWSIIKHVSVDQKFEFNLKVLISCPALSFLPLGQHFNDLLLKSPTRIEHVGCCLLKLVIQKKK